MDAATVTAPGQSHDMPDLRGQTVAVVGLGYVGLPTALSLVNAGCTVIGYDISEDRLATIKAQRADLLPSDKLRLRKVLGTDRLALTTQPHRLSKADAVIVCVPTPVDAHQNPDLRALTSACETVVANARPGQLVVLTSTTYVGCTRDLVITPLQARDFTVGHDVFVAFSPERIDPGNAAHVPESTPRVVGGATDACARRATALLERTAAAMHVVSSTEAAELTKLLENTFRAVNIAFANEFAGAATELGVDPIEVIGAAATKPYGFMPFYPGPGVGGHCIPCDPHYLLWQLRARKVMTPVSAAAMEGIAGRPRMVVERARQVLAEHGRPLKGSRILVVGVAYKPDVEDVRESPALEIMARLRDGGAEVSYSDPYVESVRLGQTRLTSHDDPSSVEWDLILLHTRHPEVDHGWLLDAPLVLDGSYRFHEHPDRHVV